MSANAKQFIIAVLGVAFLASLIFVQWTEVTRRQKEAGIGVHAVSIPKTSQACVKCHEQQSPGIVDHWKGSTHAVKGIGCLDCHIAKEGDVDAFKHEGSLIATVVTPLDCGRCHEQVAEEFGHSHHAAAGNILASLDNFLAETVEGSREAFSPHSPTPGRPDGMVNGMASASSGCKQCHGSKMALVSSSGGVITVDDLKPDENGQPTNKQAAAQVLKKDGRPVFSADTWPNTGIGRINLDGSRGSCSACHSRHDFSPRRARRPENCGKCHLGPDHPQKEIYEESKHGVAYRDLKDHMNLDSKEWVLGKDYTAAPTCATCHMSANSKNPKITHDPGERISWTNRPPVSLRMDTNKDHGVIKELDPDKRRELISDSWQNKRARMTEVCSHCHSPNYIESFYKQYDDFVVLFNEKFAKPGKKIMTALKEQGLISKTSFDEKIEWTWFYLWHHEGRRARHGASMMAPDYAHWHGMYEVAERFYMELIPEAREIVEHAASEGKTEEAAAVQLIIEDILIRPEHKWFEDEKRAREAEGREDAASFKADAEAKDAVLESAVSGSAEPVDAAVTTSSG